MVQSEAFVLYVMWAYTGRQWRECSNGVKWENLETLKIRHVIVSWIGGNDLMVNIGSPEPGLGNDKGLDDNQFKVLSYVM